MSAVVRVPVVRTGVRIDRTMFYAPTSCAPPAAGPQGRPNVVALCTAGALAAALTAVVWSLHGAEFGVYLILGLLLGIVLCHSRFGFASAWQRLTSVGNGQGMRAQALLLGTAASAVALVSATGAGLFGATPTPVANPLGLSLVVGAVLFGIGMQLAGSCASGTLFAVGAGQSMILPTLGAFIVGEVLCSWAYPVIRQLPETSGVLLADHLGWLGSWSVTVVLLVGVVLVTWLVQWRRRPPPAEPPPTARGIARLYRGTWPVFTGAVVLGVLAGLVFLTAGGVWGVANAFNLWGAKILHGFGAHPENWEYWRTSTQAPALGTPVLMDQTSLTNFGIMIGAAAAAAAAGAWRLHSRVPWRTTLAAVLGGLAMGVGTRLCNGCNVGAFIGGISQGSLSGWLWGAFALVGAYLGTRMRPRFGLVRPTPDGGIC